ncbi:MBL fold metallo-hydrolase [Proteobacteria bacterium 005FR1]|nr:MBL fold metallo-hydrolase [Proteobacteria bacterium 005FR1]
MFVDKVQTEGLAHFSYVVGDGTTAAVIDPRRDCAVYIDVARKRGAQITHILETHSNEDFVSGAVNLAEATGAKIYHGPAPDAAHYAETTREGDTFMLGKLTLKVLETPGHTDDSLSFAIYDRSFGKEAIGVFTGDALFIGAVGRTDFYPDRAPQVAGLLYDSLSKLITLGDQTIIFPAHGAGSICGDNMADRDFSTIGFERRNNPMLKIESREEFVRHKLEEHHYQPPYFRLMEKLNKTGMEEAPELRPPPLTIDEFLKAREDATLVDVRNTSAFLGAHIPDSLSMPVDTVAGFAGWLLEPEQSVILIADDEQQASLTAQHLARIGYDNVVGYLGTSLPAWAAAGQDFKSITTLDVEEVERDWREKHERQLLDVRSIDELAEGSIPGAQHIYVGELPQRLDELDPHQKYTVLCASGVRSTIAASVMARAGFSDVAVFMGSMGAWQQAHHKTA